MTADSYEHSQDDIVLFAVATAVVKNSILVLD